MFDDLLTAVLVLAVPGYNLWRSLARRHLPPAPRGQVYRRGVVLALVLAGLLAVDWASAGRSMAMLGFDWPPLTPGGVGLALAAGLLVIAAVASRSAQAGGKADEDAAAMAMLPRTALERRQFLTMVLVVGVVWEVLYRGYLIWALPSRIGLPAAVAVAAIAYGVAHGYKTPRQFGASLVSALLFTLGYALTHSLWWLIALHAGLPVVGVMLRKKAEPEGPTPAPLPPPAVSG